MPSLVSRPSRIAAASPWSPRRVIAGAKEDASSGSHVAMCSGPGAPNQPSGESAAVASVMPW